MTDTPSESCLVVLRREVLSSLKTTFLDEDNSPPSTIEQISTLLFQVDEVRQRDAVRAVLELDDPAKGLPLLIRFVTDRASPGPQSDRPRLPGPAPSLAKVDAATLLAAFGDPSGLPLLRSVGTLTNSQIEFFYAKAAFVLLGQPIPTEIGDKHSVFRAKEHLIADCLAVRGGRD